MNDLWRQSVSFASSLYSSFLSSPLSSFSSSPTPTPQPLPTISPFSAALDEQDTWHPRQLYSSISALAAPYTDSHFSVSCGPLLPLLLWTILLLYLVAVIITLIRGARGKGKKGRPASKSLPIPPSPTPSPKFPKEISSSTSTSPPPSPSAPSPSQFETNRDSEDYQQELAKTEKRKKEEKEEAKKLRASKKRKEGKPKKKKRAREEEQENEGGIGRKVRNLLLLAGKRKQPAYNPASVVLIQKLWRGRVAQKQLATHKKRRRIVQEIVDTEKSYVQALQTMITSLSSSQSTVLTDSYFHVALRNLNASFNIPTIAKMKKKKNKEHPDYYKEKEKKSKKPLVSMQDLKTIFSQTEVIYNFNNHFLQTIQGRLTKWHYEQTIGDIFLNVMDFYKVYTECVNGYSAAMMTLTACEASKKFCRFLDECNSTAAEMGGLRSLPSYLIQPVQRLPRYVLLLQDLLKHTNERHPDFGNLTKATQRMRDVAQMVDERHKQAELLNHMFQIQNETKGLSRGYDFATVDSAEITTIATGPLLAPHRRLTKMGKLSLSVEGKSPRAEDVQCYLFTDLLLVLSEQQPSRSPRMERRCRYRLPLLTLSLPSCLASSKGTEDGKFMLSTSRETFVFGANNAEEGAEWTASLRDNIRRLLEKQATFEAAKQGKKE